MLRLLPLLLASVEIVVPIIRSWILEAWIKLPMATVALEAIEGTTTVVGVVVVPRRVHIST